MPYDLGKRNVSRKRRSPVIQARKILSVIDQFVMSRHINFPLNRLAKFLVPIESTIVLFQDVQASKTTFLLLQSRKKKIKARILST